MWHSLILAFFQLLIPFIGGTAGLLLIMKFDWLVGLLLLFPIIMILFHIVDAVDTWYRKSTGRT